MSLLTKTNNIAKELELVVETGGFTEPAPDLYLVLTPLLHSYEYFSDNKPQVDVEEIRVSIFSKGNYNSTRRKLETEFLKEEIFITDRRYIEYEEDTGYHHYVIDIADFMECH